MRESPTKLKRNAKRFLKVLQKHNVSLDERGEPDLSAVASPEIRQYLESKHTLVKVTLLLADLEFEYPQKIEKLMVRADILSWLEEEEEKLKNLALQEYLEREADQRASQKLTPGEEFLLTVDDYYGNPEYVREITTNLKLNESGLIEKQLT